MAAGTRDGSANAADDAAGAAALPPDLREDAVPLGRGLQRDPEAVQGVGRAQHLPKALPLLLELPLR
eukprot:CAMPEP_0174377140 /NCGR_PEP_ID=MMETSP0811_2-20130205/121021_1 /TAXON_ID=73025 ORGANISM="Eutreptiella gymnastica-like, Strain CCMP1594" /NCGR_SAMPLE_ID=MMETSP0811_2 /ASSEMBLY_ACC=CAM_ASM_000667 /LENGTH=66 /DNA_ID=CAMNT_0015529095 /DNA_START=608 /DNA_END=805 /DNA_ORIENTATION=-